MLLNGRKLFTIMAVCKQNYVYDALSRLIFDSIPGDPIDARSAAPGWASHLRHCLNCSFNKHLTIKRCTLNTTQRDHRINHQQLLYTRRSRIRICFCTLTYNNG